MNESIESTNRRTVLRGAAILGGTIVAGGALAACGGESATEPAATDPGAGTESGPTSAAPSGSDLGSAADVPVGGGKVYAAEKIVVTQPKEGEFKAFTAVCTHQGCLVNSVSDGEIHCPCHGSAYSITDGSVVGGPAPAPVKSEKVVDDGGTLRLG